MNASFIIPPSSSYVSQKTLKLLPFFFTIQLCQKKTTANQLIVILVLSTFSFSVSFWREISGLKESFCNSLLWNSSVRLTGQKNVLHI